jgi:hypothetical protein
MSRTALASILLLLPLATAYGQADVKVHNARVTGVGGEPTPAWVAAQVSDPDDPRVKAYAARQKVRVRLERELGKIRFDYFRAKKTEIRQAGILKLKEYTDPVVFPSLYSMFKREGGDVRSAILDHLAEQRSDEADTVIAWGAVFDQEPSYRAAAAERLTRRLHEKDGGAVSGRVRTVVAQGLSRADDATITAAAQLAQTLKLYEAIPMLISAQIGGSQQVGTSGGDGDDHSLAWIMIGTQQAYVADLTPVVGDSAVAFDPTIGVVTDGVVLRVIDATVITYRMEVHNALVGMSSEAWGKPTHYLGWDNNAWRKWYTDEFLPSMAAKRAEATPARKVAPEAAEPGPG